MLKLGVGSCGLAVGYGNFNGSASGNDNGSDRG